MSAVMLDDEKADQKSGGWNSQGQDKPVTVLTEQRHEPPQRRKQSDCQDCLENRFAVVGQTVRREAPQPQGGRGRRRQVEIQAKSFRP